MVRVAMWCVKKIIEVLQVNGNERGWLCNTGYEKATRVYHQIKWGILITELKKRSIWATFHLS